MLLDVWTYVKPAAWAALDPGIEAEWPHDFDEYNFRTWQTGFWKSYPGGYEVYNLLCTADDLAEIRTALGADRLMDYAWIQGNGLDDLDTAPTIPAEVLVVMMDHENDLPATYENPNWGHVFIDQPQRIFSGAFSAGFSKGFL